MKRHSDAIGIQQGACNPSGIALAIVAACREMRETPGTGTDEITSDPAIRLMVHQLAFICKVDEINHGNVMLYPELIVKCETEAKEECL